MYIESERWEKQAQVEMSALLTNQTISFVAPFDFL